MPSIKKSASGRSAYILRMTLGGKNRVPEALKENRIIIGWSIRPGLMASNLTHPEMREIVKKHFYPEDENYRRSGLDAGEILRFRDMQVGDLVVVPQPGKFYVAEVAGDPYFDKAKVADDTAYRRPVKWLNNKKPIPRRAAKGALQSRMKFQRTLIDGTDLLEAIEETLIASQQGKASTFDRDLRSRLIREALEEIRNGRLNDFAFEELVAAVLRSAGAADVRIVPRRLDKGADIIATFGIASAFDLKLAVQAKYHQSHTPIPPGILDELLRGMEAEDADLGIFVTSGVFSDEFLQRVGKLRDAGTQVQSVDGEQLATMIVEGGLLVGRERLALD
jgi:predicted Mrr-cat superfamily restriction endonuclease